MSNIFEQFQGADLDRLIECIKAVRAAGLTIDKYTHSGVNENSGNVWMLGDGWSACVYCSIGFDVRWSYFCNECGEEHDFDTYLQADDYAMTYGNQQCESCHEETEEAKA